MPPDDTTATIHISSGRGAAEIPAAVLEHLAEAMLGLRAVSGPEGCSSDVDELHSGSEDSEDYDDLDYTDLNWTGGRYDYQEQKDFIKKIVLHLSGYKHDPTKSSKERYEERKCILNHRDTQHRRVFSLWPLSDEVTAEFKFNPLLENPKLGGRAPPNTPAMWDGPGIWGATLFDHYNLYPTPGALFQTSGSKMLEWCLENGDTHAAPQMAWAMTEPDPELIEPCDIGRLIRDGENRMRMFFGIPSNVRAPPLQEYIPQHRLPETLIVYDPDQLLYTSTHKGSELQQKYRLKFAAKYDKRRKDDEACEANAISKNKQIRDAFVADPHTRNAFPDGQLIDVLPEDSKRTEGPTARQFFYIYPPAPTRAPIKEARLHVSKNQAIGVGNHSYVYDARFVVPRSTFFDPEVCKGCILDDIQKQISDYKFSSSFFEDKAGKMVYKHEPVPPKYRFSKVTPAPPPRLHKVLAYEGPLVVLQSTVKYSHNLCRKHFPDAKSPPATAQVRVVAKFSIENDAHLAREAENYQHFPRYLFEHWSGLIKVRSIRNPVPAGPVVPQFYGYYVPEGLEEDTPDRKGEPSGNDNPSEDNTAEDTEEREPSKYKAPFLSPILLIENCGTPIQPDDYGYDDTQECCSLIYRLRDAGFNHASVAKRNILAQQGPLCAWPLERTLMPGNGEIFNPDGGPSGMAFRLIDFGRTQHVDSLDRRARIELTHQDQGKLKNWADGRDTLQNI